jgi:hypothetical protein
VKLTGPDPDGERENMQALIAAGLGVFALLLGVVIGLGLVECP